jgi:hypothetical protein
LQELKLILRGVERICRAKAGFAADDGDQRRRIMDYLGVVILGCFAFAGLMGWLANRK